MLHVNSVRRSLPVRLIGRALLILRDHLPQVAYRVFYKAGFAVWMLTLRLLYRRKILLARIRHDDEQLAMYRVVHRAMRYSLVGSSGLEATYRATAKLVEEGIDGCLVECGVAQGGCSALMASVAKTDCNRTTWLFDSFQGLPDPTDQDFGGAGDQITGENIRPLEKGSCLGTIDTVENVLFEYFGLNPTRIRLIQGWFQETLPAYRDSLGPIAMLRIDGDWYESTKCCLDNLYDKLVPGGCCIADDYGTFYGCRRAVDEFLHKRNLIVDAWSDGRGGLIFFKPAEADLD